LVETPTIEPAPPLSFAQRAARRFPVS
ncbi:MAG: VanZ family protein, partial [Caulobacter sp.]